MPEALATKPEDRFEHSSAAIIFEIDDIKQYMADLQFSSIAPEIDTKEEIEKTRLERLDSFQTILDGQQIFDENFLVVEGAKSTEELDSKVKNKVEGYISIIKHASEISEALDELESIKEKPRYIRFFVSTDEKSGRRIMMMEFNKDIDIHAGAAYAGAKKSRDSRLFLDIITDVSGKNAGKNLATIFSAYGHASVADMSPLMLYIDNINMNDAFTIFNYSSVGGGQELSTRYVEFGEQKLKSLSEHGLSASPELEQRWRKLHALQAKNYDKWLAKLKPEISDFLSRQDHDKPEKLVDSTVKTRSLDVARYWLPMGSRTGMCYLTSSRNWVDIARQLYQSDKETNKDLADHIIDVLKFSEDEDFADIKANLAGLTKYYEGTDTIQNNLHQLELQSSGHNIRALQQAASRLTAKQTSVEVMWPNEDKYSSVATITQYLSLIYPDVHPTVIRNYLNQSDDSVIEEFGETIFQGHTQHDQMARAGDMRGIPAVVDTAVGLQRDLNRHRSFGRLQIHLDALDAVEALNSGFNMSYGVQNAEYWQKFETEWLNDFENFYEQMYEVIDELEKEGNDPAYTANALLDVLPLAHQTRAIYSGPANQLAYMTSLRVAVGGDYGYRDAVWRWLEALRQDPGYRHMSSHLEKPDINDVGQLLGRS